MGATCAKERPDWSEVKKGPGEETFVDKDIDSMRRYNKSLKALRHNSRQAHDLIQGGEHGNRQASPRRVQTRRGSKSEEVAPSATAGGTGWGSDGDTSPYTNGETDTDDEPSSGEDGNARKKGSRHRHRRSGSISSGASEAETTDGDDPASSSTPASAATEGQPRGADPAFAASTSHGGAKSGETTDGEPVILRPYSDKRPVKRSVPIYRTVAPDMPATGPVLPPSGLSAETRDARIAAWTEAEFDVTALDADALNERPISIPPLLLAPDAHDDVVEARELALLDAAAGMGEDDDDEAHRLAAEDKVEAQRREKRTVRITNMAAAHPARMMGFRNERGAMYVVTRRHFLHAQGVARKGLPKDLRMEIARARRQQVVSSELERQLILKYEDEEAHAKSMRSYQYVDESTISAFL